MGQAGVDRELRQGGPELMPAACGHVSLRSHGETPRHRLRQAPALLYPLFSPSLSAAQPRRHDRAPLCASLSSLLDDIVFNPATKRNHFHRATYTPRQNTTVPRRGFSLATTTYTQTTLPRA